jgi:hypothetical protein
MSIHTRKTTDSCRDKDCIEDLRVYLTTNSQAVLDSAANAKVRYAELITTYIDVEPVAFDRNHYCIDLTFYYRILADAIVSGNRPTTLQGLAVFSKRAILCGEDSRAHIYRSNTRLGRFDSPSTLFANLPTAIVETVDTKQISRMHNASGFYDTVLYLVFARERILSVPVSFFRPSSALCQMYTSSPPSESRSGR